MKCLYRKILRKLGLHRKFKTEKVGKYIVTYDPSTVIGGHLFVGEQFEKDELKLANKYINSGSTILDIGANIGLHTLHYSAVAKNGLVIACEPQPETFKTLLRNIYQNDVKNVTPLNIAISDTAKIADFYIMSDDAYSSLIDTARKALSEKIRVLCTTIDGLLGEIKVDFVKIDVEGMELSVLHSMCKLIQRSHPVIFCEIYKGNVESYDPHDTISYLENMGYLVNRIIDGVMIEFCSNNQHDDRYFNYIFLPKEEKSSAFVDT